MHHPFNLYFLFSFRYFYTHSNSPREARYCDEELDLLKKRTLRDILCDVGDVDTIPLDPFNAGKGTPVSCEVKNPMDPSRVCIAESNEADNFIKDAEDFHKDEGERIFKVQRLTFPNVLNSSASSSTGEVALLAGGYDGWRILDTVELFSPNDTCHQRLTELPNQVLGLLALYLEGNLLACGGRTVQGFASRTCYRFIRDTGRGSWVDDPKLVLNEPRYEAAGAEVDGRVEKGG